MFGFTTHPLIRVKEKSIRFKDLGLELTEKLKGKSKGEGPHQFPHTSTPNGDRFVGLCTLRERDPCTGVSLQWNANES